MGDLIWTKTYNKLKQRLKRMPNINEVSVELTRYYFSKPKRWKSKEYNNARNV